jgi:hypothetical protein
MTTDQKVVRLGRFVQHLERRCRWQSRFLALSFAAHGVLLLCVLLGRPLGLGLSAHTLSAERVVAERVELVRPPGTTAKGEYGPYPLTDTVTLTLTDADDYPRGLLITYETQPLMKITDVRHRGWYDLRMKIDRIWETVEILQRRP